MRRPFSLRPLTRPCGLLLLIAVVTSLGAGQPAVTETPKVVAPATIRPPAATPELTASEAGQPPLPHDPGDRGAGATGCVLLL